MIELLIVAGLMLLILVLQIIELVRDSNTIEFWFPDVDFYDFDN